MEITPLVPGGRQLIQSYGGGGFTVAGSRHVGSIVILPERTLPWTVATATDLSLASLDVVTATGVDLVLIGTGAVGTMVPPTLRAALKAAGVAAESMTTASACRTFNVLLAEDRRVAAALMAIE